MIDRDSPPGSWRVAMESLPHVQDYSPAEDEDMAWRNFIRMMAGLPPLPKPEDH